MFTAYAVRKVKKVTDYGKSQGCNYILSGANEGCAPWWLRSPYNGAQENIRYVSRADGVIKNDTAAYNSNYGTVPALRITL